MTFPRRRTHLSGIVALLALTVTMVSVAIAQDVNLNDIPESTAAHAKAEATDANPHPVISTDSNWATAVVILIGGMFVAAILIGSVIKLPAAAADTHGYDVHGHDDHSHGDDHGHDSHGHDAPGHDAHGH